MPVDLPIKIPFLPEFEITLDLIRLLLHPLLTTIPLLPAPLTLLYVTELLLLEEAIKIPLEN